MLSRYWGAIFASIGLTIVAFGTGVYLGAMGDDKNGNAQNQSAQSEPPRYSPHRVPSIVRSDKDVTGSDYQKACKDARERAASDLCAQWTAANAAQKAANVAEWQLWASIGGIFGLVVTLGLTIASTKAATRQARVAERTLTEIERPYLFIDNVITQQPITFEWNRGDENLWFDAFYRITNHGRTPAIIYEFYAHIYIGDALPKAPHYHPADIREMEIVIPTGEHQMPGVFYRKPITDEMINALYVSRSFSEGYTPTRCYLYGYVKYRSVHGMRDEIGFIWEYLVINNEFIHRQIENYDYRKQSDPESDRDKS